MKIFTLFFCIFYFGSSFSQNMPPGVAELLEDARKTMQEHEALMQKLQDEMMGSMHRNSFSFSSSQNYQWVKSGDELIFELSYDQKKGMNFDVTVEDSRIKIVEKSISGDQGQVRSFSSSSQVISIPPEVDATKPRFENKDGKILIHFKYIKKSEIEKEGVI